MNELPFISIVLPTYNRADLIIQAVDSVLCQTYSNYELLIWDDGSSDETETVIQSYADKRIRYFFESNHGKSYALNQAIQRSRGAYLAFLDDDDQWLPLKLEEQVNAMIQNPEIDFIFGNFRNINKQKGREGLGFDQNTRGLEKLQTRKLGDKCFIIEAGWLNGISTANFIAFDTVLIKKDLYIEIGPFNEKLNGSEDFEYWWRFGLRGFKAAYIDVVILTRVKYPGSLSGGNIASIENHLDMLDACKMLSRKQNQLETISYLKPMYRNAWQNMITASSQSGDWQGAWKAFLKAVGFGFRPGTLRLFLKGIRDLYQNKRLENR